MKTIAHYTWAYQGLETDSHRLFIGVGPTFDQAVLDAIKNLAMDGWETRDEEAIVAPGLESAMHVQTDGQQDTWLVTLFVSDEPLPVAVP